MPNRINYQLEMEKVLRTLDGTRPKLLLHACCAPCSSATLERLSAHFDLTILYYNPNIYPPEEYHRREAELERFVEQAGYHYPVVELPYDPQEFYTAVKPCLVLASFWSVVRSYRSGVSSVFSLRSAFVTVAVPADFTLLYSSVAGSFSFHFSEEENFTVPSSQPSVAIWSCQKASGVKRRFSQ